MTLKSELAIVSYIKNGCDADATIKNFPGRLTKQTLNKYIKSDDGKEYIANMNSQIENTLKINKTALVAETLDIQQITKEEGDYKTSLQAIKQVSTLMGYDAPTTVDVNVDLSSWLIQQPVIHETEVIENDTK